MIFDNSVKRDLVSIIVPIFEVEDYIDECLQSIIDQTYENIEIICVNDATMDNSVSIVKRFMCKDDRIKLVHNDVNLGLGGARNTGLGAATGKYIYFVDSDDWIDSNTIDVLVNLIEVTGCEWSMIALVVEDGGPKQFKAPFIDYQARAAALMGVVDYAEKPEFVIDVYPSAWISLHTRDLINRANAQFPPNRLYEDHEFHYKCAFATTQLAYTEKHLYHYRSNRSGQITRDASLRNLEIFETIDGIKAIFEPRFDRSKRRLVTMKVVLRLLLERIFVLQRGSIVEKKFFEKAETYLEGWSIEELLQVRPDWASEEWVTSTVSDIRNKKRQEIQTFGVMDNKNNLRLSSRLVRIFTRPVKNVFKHRYHKTINHIADVVRDSIRGDLNYIIWSNQRNFESIEEVKKKIDEK